ncbi:MAG: aminotransferase class I/II-fold pyridoxal phosphate-dependent enzyme [Bernardetiaceae bacterium]|jgi:7-keto-8-aminopelargonate synthetase-like enzyme|nr:aminotransferase class I/II-fold pyridoxal phosphate-dependent enzyme [Bernardetiaceae bacterium]
MSVKTTDRQATAGFEYAASQQVIHLSTQDEYLDGRTITVNGQVMTNFGSCSYLGLELHPDIKAGAVEAAHRFGAVFSSSRSYTQLGLFAEVEDLLSQIYNGPTLVATCVTMGHLGVLPAIIEANDALIMDQQVHASVQMAVATIKGTNPNQTVEKIKHSNLAMLENRIAKLSATHDKIWYLIDGVYSMFGDGAPLSQILELLDRHPNLYLYCDDAHGMSWTGRHGAGYFRQHCHYHAKVVLASSLSKAFGASGGAFVFPTEAMKQRVRLLGGTFIFTIPLAPPMLGACLASARIHLSPEITTLQKALQARISHFVEAARALHLPLVGSADTPIQFVGIGKTEAAVDVAKRLQMRGLYMNMSGYPIVPPGKAGLRITITNHQTFQDLTDLAQAIREELDHQATLNRQAQVLATEPSDLVTA